MFEKTKAKIETQLNDRVTAPIQTSLIISITALIIAGIALMVATNRAA